jgi:hypothetical protein
MQNPRRYIQRLGPYSALLLLAAPLVLVETSKLAAIYIVGDGHWITGTVVMIVAYASSLLVVERLFKIVKPKLLTLPWFVTAWAWLIAIRNKMAIWTRRLKLAR